MIKVLHLLLKFIDKWIKSPLKLLKLLEITTIQKPQFKDIFRHLILSSLNIHTRSSFLQVPLDKDKAITQFTEKYLSCRKIFKKKLMRKLS